MECNLVDMLKTYEIEELNPCKKLNSSKPIGTREKGRPPVRWLDNVQQDLQNTAG
jgi:hypothetical protein